MKLFSHTLVILALYALSSSASPATSPANVLEKRAEKCKIHGNLARCRRSASLSATIFGEFAAGTVRTEPCTELKLLVLIVLLLRATKVPICCVRSPSQEKHGINQEEVIQKLRLPSRRKWELKKGYEKKEKWGREIWRQKVLSSRRLSSEGKVKCRDDSGATELVISVRKIYRVRDNGHTSTQSFGQSFGQEWKYMIKCNSPELSYSLRLRTYLERQELLERELGELKPKSAPRDRG
ncbi:hypothetical protein B0H14DRAFT_2620581 [Mycena olivaceomarginata]|nr:hypothetical protein B0H14DRAFT_2620581 [Mycena olivaceomarginata]